MRFISFTGRHAAEIYEVLFPFLFEDMFRHKDKIINKFSMWFNSRYINDLDFLKCRILVRMLPCNVFVRHIYLVTWFFFFILNLISLVFCLFFEGVEALGSDSGHQTIFQNKNFEEKTKCNISLHKGGSLNIQYLHNYSNLIGDFSEQLELVSSVPFCIQM